MSIELDHLHGAARHQLAQAKNDPNYRRIMSYASDTPLKIKDGNAALMRSVQAVLRNTERPVILRVAAATTLIETKVLEAVA